MQTLSYGFKKPQTGDKGSVFFPALEDNFQQLNDHTHNGTNSARLTSASVTVVTGTASAASWVAVDAVNQPGTYKQSLTMPVGMLFDDYHVAFRNSGTGEQLFLSLVKTGISTFDVYINDNSINLYILYGS
jgi:hypothetical protein